ncbi:hypothetical protein PSH61_01460 [Pseudomonas rhodesiae]|uniref:hypothetical protein n=1 Tax=Pseudomonas rhodesiae TaxID=76760 RepID=UPI002736C877|nr:hypothetical protein [Pseudomonas rhodesiae]WLI29800.1 hypothetical protein PSH61_01460 [Pseudomonas rhodesiae]
MDDEGDFKKARGFLLTYSAFVLALCYFGADLTQFKLMGNEIKLQHRTESAWLILAIVNIYFWFRCYQRVPNFGLYFDEPMNDLYDAALVWSALRWKRLALNKEVQKNFHRNYKSEGTIQMDPPFGEASARLTVRRKMEENWQNASPLHRISRADRTKLILHRNYSHTNIDGQTDNQAGGGHFEYEPTALFTWPVKTFVIMRGIFITPWFTDHVAPLVLGGVSTCLALCKWYAINFCTADHPFSSMLCGT